MQSKPVVLSLACHRFDRDIEHEPTHEHVLYLNQVHCDCEVMRCSVCSVVIHQSGMRAHVMEHSTVRSILRGRDYYLCSR
jgi:hypothetical protein